MTDQRHAQLGIHPLDAAPAGAAARDPTGRLKRRQVLRRTRLGILLPRGALDHLTRIRALCAPWLPWDQARWETELARYRALIAAHYTLPPAQHEGSPA